MKKPGFSLFVLKGIVEQKHVLPAEATCLSCRQEWFASGTHGTCNFECPYCGAFKGKVNVNVNELHEPEAHDEGFRCQCGGENFFIMRKKNQKSGAVYCRECGTEAKGWF
ncbi:hypothetical protein [Pseudomonas sp. FP1740]|uniref:hypothetical protein n=1 Tax=Pseudomonas sp. FP1740 TaxID=2954078 RepID=UPI0027371B2B|nr:hypothetical protein [Pseudomonas sp. FP1740]WLG43172.1 hypothetical protein PSH69_20090 [Pseudomonas sp. FP1740]